MVRYFILNLALGMFLQAVALGRGVAADVGSPAQALQVLQDGNLRFRTDEARGWRDAADRREEFAPAQHPMACVVTCSDSRVPPEIIFDLSLGDLFICRIAGNVVSPEVAGSVEYAVEHLGVPLVVVMGHSHCGAVAAAIASPDVSGPISQVLNLIQPAVDICRMRGVAEANLKSETVSTNANMGCAALYESCPAVQEAIEAGRCMLVSAVYDIESGEISWETQLTSVSGSSTAISALEPDDAPVEPPLETVSGPGDHAELSPPVTGAAVETAAREAVSSKPARKPSSRPRRY